MLMETVYMERGTPLPRYFLLPQFILDADISSTSKILFALLLNRANLSQKNVGEDDEGHVYCTYTIEDMAKDMNKGVTAIKNPLNELTREGLLERVRADFGQANHLHIKIPVGADTVSKPPVIKPEKQQAVGYKSAPNKAGIRPLITIINHLITITKEMKDFWIIRSRKERVYDEHRRYEYGLRRCRSSGLLRRRWIIALWCVQ